MGNAQRLPAKLSSEDETKFRQLVKAGYLVTSPKDPGYNCVAHAAGDNSRKWDSSSVPLPGYYWPETAHRGNGAEHLRSAFESIGYEVCAGGDVELGFDKVVLYVDDDGAWTHAARQVPLDNGCQWSSKLGNEEDISHLVEHCFGDSYGKVIYYMRRVVTENIDP